MMMSTHGKHPKQINRQTHGTDEQKLACIHLRRIQSKERKDKLPKRKKKKVKRKNSHPLDPLENNKPRNKDQKNAIPKATQSLHPAVSKAEPLILAPRCHHAGTKPNGNGQTIEKHVDRVGDEAEGVGVDAVEELNEHVEEVEEEEGGNFFGVGC